ncbi:hypothetical protein jhhlp_004280 [Lomentospora prolificans]|uniref:4-coumarate:coenzyme A ligase n=1 Tax=Lomentospora prolificans TaxID=41688 RepID=A0A2N3NB50_9PEZI|nr:hypothetical protein jhhlp_004280 [Lomentospora prolificans]
MVVRIPLARSSESLCYGVAGVGALAPFFYFIPGVEERLAVQTARWAPRWERNISFITPTVQRGIQRVEPPVSKTFRRIENRLPLEKVARRVDNGIKRGIVRASK